jgi:hypothetical protein
LNDSTDTAVWTILSSDIPGNSRGHASGQVDCGLAEQLIGELKQSAFRRVLGWPSVRKQALVRPGLAGLLRFIEPLQREMSNCKATIWCSHLDYCAALESERRRHAAVEA